MIYKEASVSKYYALSLIIWFTHAHTHHIYICVCARVHKYAQMLMISPVFILYAYLTYYVL